MFYLGILFLVSIALTNNLFQLRTSNILYLGVIPFTLFLFFNSSGIFLTVWFLFVILSYIGMADRQSHVDEKIIQLAQKLPQ